MRLPSARMGRMASGKTTVAMKASLPVGPEQDTPTRKISVSESLERPVSALLRASRSRFASLRKFEIKPAGGGGMKERDVGADDVGEERVLHVGDDALAEHAHQVGLDVGRQRP